MYYLFWLNYLFPGAGGCGGLLAGFTSTGGGGGVPGGFTFILPFLIVTGGGGNLNLCVFSFILGIVGDGGFAGGGGGGVWLNAGAAKAKPTAINMGTFSFISFHFKKVIWVQFAEIIPQ